MKHPPRTLGAILAAGVLALSACSGASDASGDIRIGTSLPLTGEFSQPGKAAKEGYEVWAAMVNESGGLLGRDIDLVIKDDGSNQNTIVADYNALISKDKVDLVLGSFSSLLNLPASAVAERNQMLYIEPAGGSPEMFSRDFEYLFYAQQATADKQGKVFADWIAELPADQRPATAAYPTLDDPFAAPNVEGIKKILEAAGVKTVYEETYAIDTRNFDTIVNAMKNAKPELVVHGAQFEDGIGLTRAMLRAGFIPEMFYETNAPSFGEQYSEGVGTGNTEGVLYAVSHSPDADTPGNAEFVERYEKMFGGEPPEDAADAFAAGEVLQAAVEAVGSLDDQEKIADWLRSNSVETVLGTLSWNKDGSPNGDFLIGQWQDGKPKIVLPEDVATDKITPAWRPAGAQS